MSHTPCTALSILEANNWHQDYVFMPDQITEMHCEARDACVSYHATCSSISGYSAKYVFSDGSTLYVSASDVDWGLLSC